MIKQNHNKKIYSLNILFQLFMVFVFPFHIWSFLMAFRDFDWVAKRTEIWDAIGLVSYALVFALVETMGFFVLMLLLGLLVPKSWQDEKRIALVGTLGMAIATWAILYEAYYLFDSPIPAILITLCAYISHPLRVLWAGATLVVVLSIGIPVFLIVRFDRAKKFTVEIFDRIILVSTIYLLFDIAGIIVILIRNLRI